MIIGAVTYMVTLTPYVVSGAYLHGWAGGYVHMDCADRLDQLTDAVCDYADVHGGILPTASNIDDLIRVIQPDIKEGLAAFRSFPIAVCPLGGAYERTPRKYQWDASLSGQQLTTMDRDRMMSRGLIACPYHKRNGTKSALRIMDSFNHHVSRPAAGNDTATSAASP